MIGYKMRRIDESKQKQIIRHISDTQSFYRDQLERYRERMLRIYKDTTSFRERPKAKRQTSFKINKAFEVENKVVPRIIANQPKWDVSVRTDAFFALDEKISSEERAKKISKNKEFAHAMRDYLSSVFTRDDMNELMEIWAKNFVRYGMWWAKIDYKYDTYADMYSKMEKYTDEEGNEIEVQSKESKEDVVWEAPCVDIVGWSDVYFDPRHIRQEDMSSIVENKDGIRLSFFTKNKDKYMNVDKLVDICTQPYNPNDPQSYKQRIYAVTGVMPRNNERINAKELWVKKYYGYYELDEDWDGSKEKLYEFWVVNDLLLVYADEISCMPFEAVRCFKDTETFLSTGFIEPILGLQDELNFKKNSASQYINQSLNRNWIWSPNSGVNPKHLNSSPGNIIPTTKSGADVEANLTELPFRQLPPNYFQEQNDFERQIQGLTFTIDTAQPQGNQAMTNTATGIRVKAFESNAVIWQARKSFEQWLVNLAYKFLQKTFENADDNIVIKKLDDDWYWEINKEAMRDAYRRYEIKVEAGSTSYDNQEQKRADAIAQWNIAQQAKAIGVNIDLEKQFKGIMETFKWVDPEELIKQPMPQIPGMEMQQPAPWWQAPQNVAMPQTQWQEWWAGDIPL